MIIILTTVYHKLFMKIIITESQFYDLIPPAIRRRMTSKDFQILDDIIHKNKRYFVAQPFDRYLDGNLHDSLNEFVHDYKAEEFDQDLDNEDWFERGESIIYEIFRQLIPFLKKKYRDLLYGYHKENHKRSGIRSINESQYEKLFNDLPIATKRRITQDDLDFLDSELSYYIVKTPPVDSFDDFSEYIIGDLLHDFVMDRKADEIETYEDPHLGSIFDETSRDNIFDLYWKLMPVLKEKYRDRMYRSWEKKRSMD
jgi:hypothetical protein